MVRTRVGYAGGTKLEPTYRDLGDHTETLELDFDPARISYEALLDVFFSTHNACRKPWSRQYASIVFWRGEAQRALAMEAGRAMEARSGKPVVTEFVEFGRFWLAEDYHQKYSLRRVPEIAREFTDIYPRLEDFVNSTAVMRANAWLGGHATRAQVDRDLMGLGLSAGAQRLLSRLTRNGG